MTWSQLIYSYGEREPRTNETYSDASAKGFHFDFFRAHPGDWIIFIDEPDLILVMYRAGMEVWVYRKTD